MNAAPEARADTRVMPGGRSALRVVELAALVAVLAMLGLPALPAGVPFAGRVAATALIAFALFAAPTGLAELARGRTVSEKPRALTEMAQSLAFSYALVCLWMDLAVSHPMRLLVGDLVRARGPAVGQFLEEFGTSVAIGGAGLFVLGLVLGESGRSRQAIPRMGSALALGIAYYVSTRGLAARMARQEWLSVEGLVLFPAVALALIQIYDGTRKFSEDAEALDTPGLGAILMFAPLCALLTAFGAIAEPVTGAAAGSAFARALIVAGPLLAPLVIGWAQTRTAPALGGEALLDAPLYRGLAGLGVVSAMAAYLS